MCIDTAPARGERSQSFNSLPSSFVNKQRLRGDDVNREWERGATSAPLTEASPSAGGHESPVSPFIICTTYRMESGNRVHIHNLLPSVYHLPLPPFLPNSRSNNEEVFSTESDISTRSRSDTGGGTDGGRQKEKVIAGNEIWKSAKVSGFRPINSTIR